MECVYVFEWDPNKARQNAKKHGVAFERAASIFRDPRAVSVFDKGHSEAEERWITMGIDQTGAIVVAIHTFKEDRDGAILIRLISARKATRNEIESYKRRSK